MLADGPFKGISWSRDANDTQFVWKIDQITHVGPTFGAPPLVQTAVTFVLLNGFLILALHLNRMIPTFHFRY